ncbi:lysozyme inhibitor LprI family protein [Rhizobium laguerreae]|uniref:hypothetical protein n=1 Tax=Rhizobium laguerreae TaxID=1076926 RepID=UPI001C92941E|nr:hypothetical protein [Rhizobium laguerreae]MBY3483325.1 hypothetical protein [Rhizobium laguerreae]
MHRFVLSTIILFSSIVGISIAQEFPDPNAIDFEHPEKYDIATPEISKLTGGQLNRISEISRYYDRTVQPLADSCARDQANFSMQHYGQFISRPCMQERLEAVSGFATIRSALTPVEAASFAIYGAREILNAISDPVQRHIAETQSRELLAAMINSAIRKAQGEKAVAANVTPIMPSPEPSSETQSQPSAGPPSEVMDEDSLNGDDQIDPSDPDGLAYFYSDFGAPIATPSFRCDGKLAPHEKAICDNKLLSTIDDIMILRFYQAREVRKEDAQKIARANYKQEVACGGNVSCLRSLLEDTTVEYMKILKLPLQEGGADARDDL